MSKMSDYTLEDFLEDDELGDETLKETLEDDGRSRKELVESAYYSIGLDIFNDIRSLFTTLGMVNKNHALLVEKRDEFVEKDALYWMENSDEEMQAFFREYLRRLHNYAASVHTLTHHTYTFMDRYQDRAPDLRSKYSEELESRNLGVKVQLLKQIRHYTQKNWQPPVSANISPAMSEDSEDELVLFLRREEMLDWDGWNTDTRKFLEGLDEEILITELATGYQEEVNDFYGWFRMLVLSEFYDEIREMALAHFQLDNRH